eukprot:6596081-Prymnesium_polylepis.1
MNYFGLDIRVPWTTHEMDTGLPLHQMMEGDWYMRMKVTRGYKYAMYIVLRGSTIIEAAGYPDYTLEVGEAVVHPIKYFARPCVGGMWP